MRVQQCNLTVTAILTPFLKLWSSDHTRQPHISNSKFGLYSVHSWVPVRLL